MSGYEQIELPKADLGGVGEKFAEIRKWDCVHTDLADKEIVVLSFDEITTQHGEALLAVCAVPDPEKKNKHNKMKVLIGGVVLIEQLKVVEEYLPLKGTIIKVKNYFTFK